jgi:hypothetical protein
MRAAITEPEQLSQRDRDILDLLTTPGQDGRPRTSAEIAARFGLDDSRVRHIRRRPAARKYLAQRAGDDRLDVHLWSLGELRRRIEHGSAIPLPLLIKLFTATMPSEPVLHIHEVRSHAERVADDLGLNGDARRKLIDYALERTKRGRAAG